MNTVLARIKEIINAKRLSPRSFSLAIGFNYSTLNNYLTGRRSTIDYELIEKTIESFDDISAEWLLRGKGKMLISDNQPKDESAERISMLVDTITTLQATINEKTKTIQLLEEKLKKAEGELAMLKLSLIHI